jgi:hypothetical protein
MPIVNNYPLTTVIFEFKKVHLRYAGLRRYISEIWRVQDEC